MAAQLVEVVPAKKSTDMRMLLLDDRLQVLFCNPRSIRPLQACLSSRMTELHTCVQPVLPGKELQKFGIIFLHIFCVSWPACGVAGGPDGSCIKIDDILVQVSNAWTSARDLDTVSHNLLGTTRS